MNKKSLALKCLESMEPDAVKDTSEFKQFHQDFIDAWVKVGMTTDQMANFLADNPVLGNDEAKNNAKIILDHLKKNGKIAENFSPKVLTVSQILKSVREEMLDMKQGKDSDELTDEQKASIDKVADKLDGAIQDIESGGVNLTTKILSKNAPDENTGMNV